MMQLVILESPFRGNDKHSEQEHIEYARACIRDSLNRGEAPIASHLLYTQEGILRDNVADERLWGINAGLAWLIACDSQIFYEDLGWSGGMMSAREIGRKQGVPQETRSIGWSKK